MAKRKYPIITIVSNRTIVGVNYFNCRKDTSVVRYQEASNLLETLNDGVGNNVDKVSDGLYAIQDSWVNSYGRNVHVHNLYIVVEA